MVFQGELGANDGKLELANAQVLGYYAPMNLPSAYYQGREGVETLEEEEELLTYSEVAMIFVTGGGGGTRANHVSHGTEGGGGEALGEL